MAFDERDWQSFLSQELGADVTVRFGRARHRVLEARPTRPAGLSIRMSAFFAEAPAGVRSAVAVWLRSGRRARRSAAVLDAFIAQSLATLPPRPRRAVPLRTAGRHHDLAALVEELADDVALEGGTLPRVTWGRETRSRARRSLQLGCYVAEENLVRVHPALDREWVPDWFVRYVLFHELLHAELPPARCRSGRTLHHGPEFRRRERQYRDYRRALAWQERNLPRLLRAARAVPEARAPRAERSPGRVAAPAAAPERRPAVGVTQGLLFPLDPPVPPRAARATRGASEPALFSPRPAPSGPAAP